MNNRPVCVAVLTALAAVNAYAVPPLAWIRFEGGEEYAGRSYRFTGDGPIQFDIDVAPGESHAIDLLWGSKRDQRGARVTINGKSRLVRGGGYDGYGWQRVAIPAGVSGKTYAVLIEADAPKAAFIAAARLVTEAMPVDAELVEEQPLSRVTIIAPRPAATWPSLEDYDAMPRLERYASQANRALRQCRLFVSGWLLHADPKTGLIPRNLRQNRDIWNAKDSAADNYPFMVLTCALTDPDMFQGRMLDILRTEEKVTSRLDHLPDTYSFPKQGFESQKPDLGAMIFGGSEYVKDGLMPLTEWLGESPWSVRMIGILDSILAHAPHQTPHGPIPSDNVEVNGEMMQVLGRVYWMTGDTKYLEMAVRIADYYLLGDHHPTRDLTRLRLDDHSCELVSGLSEVYFTCHHARKEKAAVYREPIHAMLDRILEIGVNEDGLMYDTIDPVAGKVTRDALTDNWGYNYNAFYTVWQLDGEERYREAVRKALRALSNRRYLTYPWEGWSSDGIADAVEGAINLYNREPVAGVETWVDANIDRMLRIQKSDGIVEGWHGDGNFARTAIMYALWKQQGATLQPWCEDVLLGAVASDNGVELWLRADKPWRGTLVFDRPRHKTVMHLPSDYPRINQIPEWFTVDASTRFGVTIGDGEARSVPGRELAEGLPVRVEAGKTLRIVVVDKG